MYKAPVGATSEEWRTWSWLLWSGTEGSEKIFQDQRRERERWQLNRKVFYLAVKDFTVAAQLWHPEGPFWNGKCDIWAPEYVLDGVPMQKLGVFFFCLIVSVSSRKPQHHVGGVGGGEGVGGWASYFFNSFLPFNHLSYTLPRSSADLFLFAAASASSRASSPRPSLFPPSLLPLVTFALVDLRHPNLLTLSSEHPPCSSTTGCLDDFSPSLSF